MSDITFRQSEVTDIAFIFDSWLNSWRKSPWAGCIPNNMYYPTTRAAIEGLIGRGAGLELAVRTADPNHILGWVCRETTSDGAAVIHYLYVKEPYLAFGIGEQLVARTEGKRPGFYTHRYRQVIDACPSSEGWTHAPEIARRK